MSANGTPWTDWQTAGLVGVDRRSWRPAPTEDALGAALGRLPAAPPARAWLGGAGLLAIYRLGGQRPAPLPPLSTAPCPPDDRRVCPPAAALRLTQLLSGRWREVLPEWLAAAADQGWRVPPEGLPALLRAGQHEGSLHPAIRAVIGRRGAWLAGEFSQGDYAAVPVAVDDGGDLLEAAKPMWETGTRRQRLRLLEWVRAQEPAMALALLSSTWAADKAEDRASFVTLLAEQLSGADEKFLEGALEDNSSEVPRAAAGLLARLPGARLGQRMAARTQPLIKLISAKRRRVALFDSKASLEVSLPEACDEALQRDGLAARPPDGQGERAWWLQQMLAATPLETWSDGGRATPEQWIVLARANEWAGVLLAGWRRAAAQQQQPAWTVALIHDLQVHPEDQAGPELWQALSPDEQENLALEFLSQADFLDQDASRWPMATQRRVWGLALSQAVLDRLATRMSATAFTGPQEAHWIMRLAYRMNPAQVNAGRQRLAEASEARGMWARVAQDFLTIWQFRADMLKELQR